MSIDLEAAIRGLMRDRAKLIGYITAIVRDRHVAEDIFQDVVALALQKHADIAGPDHLPGWSRRCARNKCLEALRRNKARVMTLDADVLDLLEAPWEQLDALDADGEMGRLRECLDKLAPRARRVVDLKFVEGLTGIQIAELVGNEVHRVYVALARAYRTLADCIQRKRPATEDSHA